MENVIAQTVKMRGAAIASRLADLTEHVAENIASDFELRQLDNGLLEASNGYYATCQDLETNDTIILYAREQEHLATDENGKLKNLDYIYVVDDSIQAPRERTIKPKKLFDFLFKKKQEQNLFEQPFKKPFLKPATIRNAIGNDHRGMTDYGWMENNISGGEVSRAYSIENEKIYMYGNRKISFTIRSHTEEDGNQKWSLRVYIPFKKINALSGFPEIDAADPDDWLIKTVFSNGFEYGRYSTLGEAVAHMITTWNPRAQDNWRGNNPIRTSESFLKVFQVAVYNTFISEISDVKNIPAPTYEAGLGLFGSIMVAGRFLGFGLASATLGLVAFTFAKQKALDIAMKGVKEVDWWIRGTKSTHPKIAKYIATDRANQRRNRIKPRPDLAGKVRVLGLKDMPKGGLSHDQRPIFSSKENGDRHIRKFVSLENDCLPMINSFLGENDMTQICSNGTVRRVRRDLTTWNKIADTGYVSEFDINDKIKLSENEIETLSGNNVIRFYQMEKCGFKSRTITNDNYKRHIKREFGDKTSCTEHLRWAFEKQADQPPQIEPDAHYPLSLTQHNQTPPEEASFLRQLFGHMGADDHRPIPSPALLARCEDFQAPDISGLLFKEQEMALVA